MHDDLVTRERGIQVRNDADAPAWGVVRLTLRKRECLRRRAVLAALAEWTRVELLGRHRADRPAAGARTPCTARREDDLVRQVDVAARSPRSMNGRIRSTGAGKTIVVDCEPPSSSSVCK